VSDGIRGSSWKIGPVSFSPGTSLAVSTAWTPGTASAADVSMARIRACACGACTGYTLSMPLGGRCSSV
jgi:hypothetical protein